MSRRLGLPLFGDVCGDVKKRSVAGAERAGICLGTDEVTEVSWALSIQGFVSEEQNLKLDPVVDWEPV